MSKRIVVELPKGSPLENLSEAEVQDLVEKVTAQIPASEHKKHADELVLQTAGVPKAKAADQVEGWVAWTRACG